MYEAVYQIVKTIPCGKVMTYGQIALMLGNPKMARVVGNALHVNPYPGEVPCHRVVNRLGELSGSFAFGGAEEQRNRLIQEGIGFLENGRIDMKNYCLKIEVDQ